MSNKRTPITHRDHTHNGERSAGVDATALNNGRTYGAVDAATGNGYGGNVTAFRPASRYIRSNGKWMRVDGKRVKVVALAGLVNALTRGGMGWAAAMDARQARNFVFDMQAQGMLRVVKVGTLEVVIPSRLLTLIA